jgi:hypothetical protein
MAKRRGNPNWGKSETVGPAVVSATSFERAVEEFKIAPDDLVEHCELDDTPGSRWGSALCFLRRVLLRDQIGVVGYSALLCDWS